MDHDKIFKQLLKTFFVEFISLFLPQLHGYLSRENIEFLDKEIFTDLTGGTRSEVDLIAKCRFKDGGAFFMIHVEDQGNPQPNFARRMFHYFARLDAEFGLPIYPIALLSYDSPLRPEPSEYRVEFPDVKVLDFQFRVVQLNRLDWKDFATIENPVASALMAKMRIEPADRASVKLACVRMMLKLPLNDAQRALLAEFVDAYLRLNADERVKYEFEVQKLELVEKEKVMAVINEWTEAALERGLEQGREQGREQGLEQGRELARQRMKNLVLRQLHHQIGELPPTIRENIGNLGTDAIDALSEALLSMKSVFELENWLTSRS